MSNVLPGDSPFRRLVYAQAELARPPVGGGLGDGFIVDPERAQVAIARLDEAILDTRRALGAFSFGKVVAPARDEVSQNLARQMQVMDDRAIAYVKEWLRQLEEFRGAVQAQIDSYGRADDEIAERLA